MPNRAKTGAATAVAIALGTGLWSGSALATDKPPSGVAAISQYVEANPTLAGPRVVTTVTPGTTATIGVSPVTAHALARLGKLDAAALLKNLSTSSQPATATPVTTRLIVATPHTTGLGGVVQSASTGLSHRQALIFGAVLMLISLACVAAAARRRTPHAPRP